MLAVHVRNVSYVREAGQAAYEFRPNMKRPAPQCPIVNKFVTHPAFRDRVEQILCEFENLPRGNEYNINMGRGLRDRFDQLINEYNCMTGDHLKPSEVSINRGGKVLA